MGETWENESHFINMGHTYQNSRTLIYESHRAKWVTFGKMGETLENESHLINMGHTWENGSHLEKMGHT